MEWLSGDVVNSFKCLDYKKNRRSDLVVFEKMYVVCALVGNTISDFHITRNAFCFPHKILHKLLFSNTLENR